MNEKWLIFFLLLWFSGQIIMLGIDSANAPAGIAALSIAEKVNIVPDTFDDGFNAVQIGSFMTELGKKLWGVMTWGNYPVLSEGGGVVIRYVLSLFSVIGVLLLIDTVRRWLPI